MPYSGVQFAAARAQVALRLADDGSAYQSANQFWADAEIGLYIVEAFQVWSALTGYWRNTGLLTVTANNPYFTLTGLTNASGNLITFGPSTLQMLYLMEYHLLETVSNASPWAGTEMFSYAQVTAAIQRRADQFAVDTGYPTEQQTIASTSPSIGKMPLTALAGFVDLRRAAWIDTTSKVSSPMIPGDEFEFNAFSVGWQQQPGTPSEYSIAVTPPLSLQLKPPPLATGSVDAIYTATTQLAALPTDSPIPLLPSDFGWAIKWGALADLLSIESEAKDAARAAYCEQRYQQGVEACRMAATAMQAYYGGVQIPLKAIEDLDRWENNWQNVAPGPPQAVGVAGLNMFALQPTPDKAYQLTFDAVCSATIPVANTDYLQIGPEELEAIYGYAQHIAAFKMGGEEFTATLPLFEAFIKAAALQNARLATASSFARFLVDRESRAEAMMPRVSGVEAGSNQ